MSKIWFYILILGITWHIVLGQSRANKQPVTSIRNIDFQNFTYPWPTDLSSRVHAKKTFRLTNGELPALQKPDGMIDEMGVFYGGIEYYDVTGDGVDEALIRLSLQTGGSAIPSIVYIYTLNERHPHLLWSFSTGDRADRGFRRAYAQAGNLVIELHSPIGSKGACCPTQFTRTQYQWDGKRFRKKRQELIPNEKSS